MNKMLRLRVEETLLLVVDVQERLVPVIFEAERVVRACALLARAATRLKMPVIVTEQNPQRLGPTMPALREVLPQQALSKMLFSACTDEAKQALSAAGRRSILLCGIEAHVCVMQTALDLRESGYEVFVPYDAVSSRQEKDKQVGWDRMRLAGMVPTSSESAIFELLREAGTADFKALLTYLK